MSHVDDGTLHAYLDGELSPVERARLETHLAECTACRGRLDEERALIERAGQLLGLATPPERAIPPLHQLRHPRPRMRWRVPVAWAATVVLAIAAGWYARGSRSESSALNEQAQPATEMRDMAAASADSGTVALDASKASGPADEAKARPSTRVPTERYLLTPQPPPAEHDALQRTEEAAPAPQPAAPAASPAVGAGLAARQQSRFDSSLVVSAITVGTVRPMPVISADSAVRLLKTELAVVPSLPIQSIRPLPGGAVQVEQAVDSTTSIMLYQWPADSPRAAREAEQARGNAMERQQPQAASRAPGGERLARYVRGLRVEISGPMSVDSLNRLLGLVQ